MLPSLSCTDAPEFRRTRVVLSLPPSCSARRGSRHDEVDAESTAKESADRETGVRKAAGREAAARDAAARRAAAYARAIRPSAGRCSRTATGERAKAACAAREA